jgi:hypothetical protein
MRPLGATASTETALRGVSGFFISISYLFFVVMEDKKGSGKVIIENSSQPGVSRKI